MLSSLVPRLEQAFAIRWRPSSDLAALFVSWLLVVGALYTATVIVGPAAGGGIPYFVLYAVVTATLAGVGIPLYWMVVVRRRPLSDLGLTTRGWRLSLGLQLLFAALLYGGTRARVQLPPAEAFVPLVALALAIGFFEALFWRGWVLLRLEEAFGIIPAIVLGSLLYAVYHVGYAMPSSEIVFLFFVGILYAVTFRLTRNVLLLWPLFQPVGQLVTLVRDELTLPPIAAVGFLEVLALMLVLVWLAGRYHQKHSSTRSSRPAAQAPSD